MKPLYTIEEYDTAKSTDLLPCECYHCKQSFNKIKKLITANIRHSSNTCRFCSETCAGAFNQTRVSVSCINCSTSFSKLPKDILRYPNHFCSQSCAATYNNKNKTTGNRRSKLEAYLESKLTELYPAIEFHFNRKDTITSELDIYVPNMNIAFELNGIFHYEPIYGSDKLLQIQSNDARKLQACLENGIELYVIDTSIQKYFKEQSSNIFLDAICQILSQRINVVQ